MSEHPPIDGDADQGVDVEIAGPSDVETAVVDLAEVEATDLEAADFDIPAMDVSLMVEASADDDADAQPEWELPRLRASVEAILFLADSPLNVVAIAAGLNAPSELVEQSLAAIAEDYRERDAGIELREVAGGVRIYTRDDLAPVIEAYLREGQRSRLTQAALETVAVIAYRQPVSRARISAIRGVSVDGVIRTLLNRGLIVETGTDADTGGLLYGTTELFLEKMGLRSLDELPSLAPLLPEIDTLEADSS